MVAKLAGKMRTDSANCRVVQIHNLYMKTIWISIYYNQWIARKVQSDWLVKL